MGRVVADDEQPADGHRVGEQAERAHPPRREEEPPTNSPTHTKAVVAKSSPPRRFVERRRSRGRPALQALAAWSAEVDAVSAVMVYPNEGADRLDPFTLPRRDAASRPVRILPVSNSVSPACQVKMSALVSASTLTLLACGLGAQCMSG